MKIKKGAMCFEAAGRPISVRTGRQELCGEEYDFELVNSLVNGVAVSVQVKAQSIGTLFRC